jgi:hypothetical protein
MIASVLNPAMIKQASSTDVTLFGLAIPTMAPMMDDAASVPSTLAMLSICFELSFMAMMLTLFLELAVSGPRRCLRDFAALGARRFAARLHALALGPL